MAVLIFLRYDQHCFPTFQTQYFLDFLSASRNGTLGVWDFPNTEIFQSRDVASGVSFHLNTKSELTYYFRNNRMFRDKYLEKLLKGQSHEKVGEMRVWGISLGPN
jgi:hypothetical protein